MKDKIRAALDLHPDACQAFDDLLTRLDAAENALVAADPLHSVYAKSTEYGYGHEADKVIQAAYKTKRNAHVAIVSPPPPRYTPAVPREDRYEPDVPWCLL